MSNIDGNKEVQPIAKDFPACQCGSKRLFMQELAQKEQAKGKIPKGMVFSLAVMVGAVLNPKIQYPPGALVTAGRVILDVCKDCGTLRATNMAEIMLPIPPMLQAPPDVKSQVLPIPPFAFRPPSL